MDAVELQVRGMECGACAERIGAVLKRVEGVREVSADHVSDRVRILLGPEPPERQVLVERLGNAGFEVVEGAAR
ncbi:heavy-metal-associated domain-containing protein [Salinifilum ghardaiensis]